MLGQVHGKALEDIRERLVNKIRPSDKILIKWNKDIYRANSKIKIKL